MFKSIYSLFLILFFALPLVLANDTKSTQKKEKKPIELEVVVEEEIELPMQPQKSEVKIDEVVAPVGANPVIERKDLTYEDALQFEIGSSYSLTKNTDVSLKGYYYDVKRTAHSSYSPRLSLC